MEVINMLMYPVGVNENNSMKDIYIFKGDWYISPLFNERVEERIITSGKI